MNSQKTNGKKSRFSTILSWVIEWAVAFIIALAVALILTQVVFINAKIPSGSMESTIMPGDRILGLRILKNPLERSDIIIFKYPDDESQLYIKRIIGMPGEVLQIKDGKVYINNAELPLDEPYLKEVPFKKDYGPYLIPQDCYFVMGDNRNDSKDARFWQNTYVHESKILGRAWVQVYPHMKIIE